MIKVPHIPMFLAQYLSRFFLVPLFVLVLAGCAGPPMAASDNAESRLAPQTFHFDDGGQARYYAFDTGAVKADDPLIIFISGSGCASVRHRFPAYFDTLRFYPVHVLALQKRGIEPDSTGASCSKAFSASDYFEQIVEDQREFIDQQLASRAIQPRAVVLMGASEGAIVAAKIASLDPRISHLALIGSGGTTMRENLRALSRTKWIFKNIESTFSAIAQDPISLQKTALSHSYKYWSSMLDVDLGDLLLPLRIPILIGMGEKDESVPLEMAMVLKRRFEQQGRTNLTVRIFPHADHRLQDAAISKSYAVDFLQELAALVHATVGVTAAAPAQQE